MRPIRRRTALLLFMLFAGVVSLGGRPAAGAIDILPRLECVEPDAPEPGLSTARWGYLNATDDLVMIPVGPQNQFTPSPADRGQPTFFSVGRQFHVFDTIFEGTSITWKVTGPSGKTNVAVASRSSLQRCPRCGDSVVAPSEECDDGNTLDGDGCEATCMVQPGWVCAGAPSVCTSSCGDGRITGNEACDDCGRAPGDGCSASCEIEPGFSCSGEPSSCLFTCGNGQIFGNETCDDGGTEAGDGCSPTCRVEPGFSCTGAPSVCQAGCGDGVIGPGEGCDDGALANGDGCSDTCTVEPGFTCSGAPSSCQPTCGDGTITGNEQCDDDNAASGDGCSASCQIETGFVCTGLPSVCSTQCGNGILSGSELCDDGNAFPGDGCTADCQIEPGFSCSGSPSVCTGSCGDGAITGGDQCDDGNLASSDGCSASCQVEPGWTCLGAPSQCFTTCGDGIRAGSEQCDDRDLDPGDGCSATCEIEVGWTCSGFPSLCSPLCGDGLVLDLEECDDGNTASGDCCSSTCRFEPLGSLCQQDENLCTFDICDGAGVCTHPPNNAPCDDGDACTVGDICGAGTCTPGGPLDCADGNACTQDVCTVGVCTNPPIADPLQADFMLVVDASKSMSKKWKTWLGEQLGVFPDALTAAGIDWRISIVRAGTFVSPKRGPVFPDVFLDWTTDGDVFRSALPELGLKPRRPIEASFEAVDWGLDRLTFRPNAIPNLIIITDEDDDAASTSSERREPPPLGPRCIGRSCESRWLAVQSRIDAIAARLIEHRVQANLVIRQNDRPATFQFGNPDCTVLDLAGQLDLGATLACLRSNGQERSLQGQLLEVGRCEGGTCSAGLTGLECEADVDCSLIARAFRIPKVRKEGQAFFPGFLDAKVDEQRCEP